MTQTEKAPGVTSVDSEADGNDKASAGAKRRLANLSRPAKGEVNEGLRRYQEARRRGELPPQWSRLTLMEHVNKALRQRNGAKLAELAESIVDNAIKGNSACLSFLAERLAPIEEKQGGGRVVFEGIKLEVVSSSGSPASLGDHQTRTTVALVRGSESHEGSTPLSAPDSTDTETVQGPREGVILESRDVRSPETPG